MPHNGKATDLPRVARTFDEAFNTADQFPTPTKHRLQALGKKPSLNGKRINERQKSNSGETSFEAKSPYTTYPFTALCKQRIPLGGVFASKAQSDNRRVLLYELAINSPTLVKLKVEAF